MMLPQLLLESLQPGPFPVFPFSFPFSLYFPFSFSLLPFLVIINFPLFFPIVHICVCVICLLVVLSLMCPNLALNSLYIFWTPQALASTSQVLRLQVSDTSPGSILLVLLLCSRLRTQELKWVLQAILSWLKRVSEKMPFTSIKMCKMSGQATAHDALGFGGMKKSHFMIFFY